jgi:hypothetical protein
MFGKALTFPLWFSWCKYGANAMEIMDTMDTTYGIEQNRGNFESVYWLIKLVLKFPKGIHPKRKATKINLAALNNHQYYLS